MRSRDRALGAAAERVRLALPGVQTTAEHAPFHSTMTTVVAPSVSVCTRVFDHPDDGVSVMVVAHGRAIVVPVAPPDTVDDIVAAHLQVVAVARAAGCDPRDPAGTEERILDAYDAGRRE